MDQARLVVEVVEESAQVLADLEDLVDLHFPEDRARLAPLVPLEAPEEPLKAAVPREALRVQMRAVDCTLPKVLVLVIVGQMFQEELLPTSVALAVAPYSATLFQDSARPVVELQQDPGEVLAELLDSVEIKFPEETLILKTTLPQVGARM